MTPPLRSIDDIDRIRREARAPGISSILSTQALIRPGRELTPGLAAEDEALIAAIDHMDTVDGALRLAVAKCPACRGDEFWASRWREGICRRCHPPAPGVEVGHA